MTPAQQWANISRHIFTLLNGKPGSNMLYRLKDDENYPHNMTKEEASKAEEVSQIATTDRRGYAQVLQPLQAVVLSGEVTNTDPRIWKLIFAIQNSSFRPTFGEVEDALYKAFKWEKPRELSGAEYEQRRVVVRPTNPELLGIPQTTVLAAAKDITINPKATRIDQMPTHDDKGNLLGEGRRKFLLAMTRMKAGLRPLPSASDFEDEEGDGDMTPQSPTPKKVTENDNMTEDYDGQH
jgi:hypothetical protein